MSTMSTPELSRIKSVRVPRRMYVASRLKSPVRVRVNLDWNEEATSVRAVRRFTKLLGGGIEA